MPWFGLLSTDRCYDLRRWLLVMFVVCETNVQVVLPRLRSSLECSALDRLLGLRRGTTADVTASAGAANQRRAGASRRVDRRRRCRRLRDSLKPDR